MQDSYSTTANLGSDTSVSAVFENVAGVPFPQILSEIRNRTVTKAERLDPKLWPDAETPVINIQTTIDMHLMPDPTHGDGSSDSLRCIIRQILQNTNLEIMPGREDWLLQLDDDGNVAQFRMRASAYPGIDHLNGLGFDVEVFRGEDKCTKLDMQVELGKFEGLLAIIGPSLKEQTITILRDYVSEVMQNCKSNKTCATLLAEANSIET